MTCLFPPLAVCFTRDKVNKTNVAHLLHTVVYGGVETVILNWICRMNQNRFNVHLICLANPDGSEEPFVRAAHARGLTVSKIPWSKRKPIFKAAFMLRRFIEKHDIDILHTHNVNADAVGLMVRFLTPVKIITTVYVWAKFELKRNILQIINKVVIQFFDMVTPHCNDTYRKTAKFIHKRKLRLLICGFELHIPKISEAERVRKRLSYGIRENQILLANIARFYPEKAQDFLLYCFKEIVSIFPNTRLWILGVGPLESELKSLCTQLNLDSKVKFLGFVENLAEILPLIDIQVHPSHMEGVPLSICSGMAAGLPIVVSDVGGIREIITHRKSGILVPEDDKRAFIAEVCDLIEKSEKRNSLGANARQFIENKYSLKHAVEEVERTYIDLLGLNE